MNIAVILGMLPTLLMFLAVIVFLLIFAKWFLQEIARICDEDYEDIQYVNKKKNR